MLRRFKAILAPIAIIVPSFALGAAPSSTLPTEAFDLRWLLALGAVLLLAFGWHRRTLKKLTDRQVRLERHEERLRHALEVCDDVFWDWDLERGRIERSDRWASMLGYLPQEITPTPEALTALVHPDDMLLYQSWQTRLISGAADRHVFEYRLRAKSGEWRWILDRGKVVARAKDGRPLRIAGTHTDITKSKNTEAALAESQAQLKRSAQLLQQSQSAARIGGWETDLRTGRVYWTPETYLIHETTPEEYHPTRDTLFQFYVPESRVQLIAAAERAIRDGTSYGLELELVTARHQRIHVHTTGVAEWENGRIVKIYGSFRDITAEKQVEQEREKLQRKMVEAQKLESLGVLAGGIAHEFNNLLTIIVANTELARTEKHGGEERLAPIDSAARRAADLCRQMLAYSGKASFLIERLDLAAVVRDTTDLVRASLGPKTRIELALAQPMPAIEGDISQLRQVVMNLVLNAAEALGGDPGVVRVATSLGQPDPARLGLLHSFDLPPGDVACLEVSDTGSGMSAETLARIFDPFFSTKFAGRGLGLPAVLGIVRAHHGALAVESHVGRGSTFRLYLPLAAGSAADSPVAAVAPRADEPSPGAILVADDEPAVRDSVAALLRHFGYEVVVTSDGAEAVERFKLEPARFRAVLLDLTMPRLDGAEAAQVIRTSSANLPILVMSGFSEEDVLARMRDVSGVAVLRKPLTGDLLAAHFPRVSAAPRASAAQPHRA